jgi:hypothetical protein
LVSARPLRLLVKHPFTCVAPFELKIPCRTTLCRAEGRGFGFPGGTGNLHRVDVTLGMQVTVLAGDHAAAEAVLIGG